MIDRFIADIGILKEDSISAEARAALVEEAGAFLRSGLSSWDFWRGLGPESRAAFLISNDRIWRERCSLIGMAAQSEINAAFVRDEEEGRDEIAKLALSMLGQKMMAQERGK